VITGAEMLTSAAAPFETKWRAVLCLARALSELDKLSEQEAARCAPLGHLRCASSALPSASVVAADFCGAAALILSNQST
jgi:hypothetical protein